MASLSLFRYSARLTILIHNDWVLEITLAFKMVKKVGHLAKPCIKVVKINRHDANLARGSCLNDRIPLCGTGFEGRGLTSACEEMSEWYWRPSSLTPIAFITFMHFHISEGYRMVFASMRAECLFLRERAFNKQLEKFCEHEHASIHLIFASNSSKGQILRALLN